MKLAFQSSSFHSKARFYHCFLNQGSMLNLIIPLTEELLAFIYLLVQATHNHVSPKSLLASIRAELGTVTLTAAGCCCPSATTSGITRGSV